jgi:hypothetical protein
MRWSTGCSLWISVLVVLSVASGCSDDESDGGSADATGDSGNPDAGGGDTTGDTGMDDGSGAMDGSTDEPEETNALIREVRRLELDQYLGGVLPEPTVELVEGDETTYVWGVDDGPLCMRGAEYRVATRTGDPERLLVFLQGGGACWDEFCLAVNSAPQGVPDVNALDLALAENPLKEWSVVYLPYCDGSLFSGDIEHDDDGDGQTDRWHRGLQNLSAALDVAKRTHPAPREVLLTGSSAGGFGTLIATMLVRTNWPDAEILVFNDSGIGVTRGDNPAFLERILEQFNLTRFIPESCEECVVSGHITPLISWTLDRDPNIRIALFSSWYDTIIGKVFLKWDPVSLAAAIEEQTGALVQAHPDRVRRFIVDGTTHTAMLGDASGVIGSDIGAIEIPPGFAAELSGVQIGGLRDTKIGDVSVGQWLEAFVTGSEDWVNLVEDAGEPPWEAPEPTP